jgi:hypothetical protein
MNENNGKRFIWLFVGLFVILFGFAGFNQASGKANSNAAASVDEMIKSIVQSDVIISDIPNQPFPDEKDVPEELVSYLRIEKERASSQKLVQDLIYVYNPSTSISSLYYLVNNNTVLLYHSTEGVQLSEKTFAPFKEKVEQTYAETL